MEEYRIRYSTSAVEDLGGIKHYILFEWQDSVIARKLIEAICNEIRKLNQLPRRFPIVESSPWKERNVHRMIVKNHIVFYNIDDENLIINILRVFSCRQDLDKIKC